MDVCSNKHRNLFEVQVANYLVYFGCVYVFVSHSTAHNESIMRSSRKYDCDNIIGVYLNCGLLYSLIPTRSKNSMNQSEQSRNTAERVSVYTFGAQSGS